MNQFSIVLAHIKASQVPVLATMKFKLILFVHLFEILLASTDLGKLKHSYRLPNNSIPIRYDLHIKSAIDKEDFNFTGRVKIHVKIAEASDLITLHYRQINIERINLYDADQNLIKTSLAFEFKTELEFVKISLPRKFLVSQEIILEISYNGTLRTDNAGFYRASYFDGNNQEVWFATTQFEMIDARHVMPCYDEPGIRAVIGLKIQHGSKYHAVSNMPITKTESVEGTDKVITTFEDTPPMQTYLLAFIISDYGYVSNHNNITEQRIYAPAYLIERGDADLATDILNTFLRKLEEVLNVKYPLPKLDHVVFTDDRYGVMENFGMITWEDKYLLFNSSAGQMSNEIISHEFTHQFFGNLVSPKWWSHAWLSEGFATLFECYLPSLIYPDSDHNGCRQWGQNRAFEADHDNEMSMNFDFETSNENVDKFNAMMYLKASAVLAMFMHAIGESTFLKGLNYYLTEMYLKAAEPRDLHRNLQKAFDEDSPDNEINLDEVMSTWEDQAGYPTVTVNQIDGGFTLTQRRSNGGEEIYSIPISYVSESNLNFNDTSTRLWMNTKSVNISTHDKWIFLNSMKTGYYKTSYDAKAWLAIRNNLRSDRNSTTENKRARRILENVDAWRREQDSI